jgi:hypothetical protein
MIGRRSSGRRPKADVQSPDDAFHLAARHRRRPHGAAVDPLDPELAVMVDHRGDHRRVGEVAGEGGTHRVGWQADPGFGPVRAPFKECGPDDPPPGFRQYRPMDRVWPAIGGCANWIDSK